MMVSFYVFESLTQSQFKSHLQSQMIRLSGIGMTHDILLTILYTRDDTVRRGMMWITSATILCCTYTSCPRLLGPWCVLCHFKSFIEADGQVVTDTHLQIFKETLISINILIAWWWWYKQTE